MTSASEGGSDDETSFYAILNVSRDATEEDIKRSFRQLAQAYHPDKHTDAALKAHASSNFTRLQEAYEVIRKRDHNVPLPQCSPQHAEPANLLTQHQQAQQPPCGNDRHCSGIVDAGAEQLGEAAGV